jgi:epsilon-lactone hydrolase
MISNEARMYHQILTSVHDNAVAAEPPSLDELRDSLEQFAEMAAPLPEDTTVEDVDADGVDVRWLIPESHGERVLVYLHGGGYVTGSAHSHTRTAGHLGRRLGARTLVVHYRRAPENRHPIPVEDCVTAYQWLLNSGVASANVVFAGESAGGALCLSTQFLARDRGLPLPGATALMSPWADMEFSGESVQSNKDKDVAASIDSYRMFSDYLLGEGGDRRDPLVSPIHGDFSEFGPIYVQVGDVELVLDDARRIAAAAQRDGVPTELDIVPDMQHLFQMWVGNMPEADAAMDRIAGFVLNHVTADATLADI